MAKFVLFTSLLKPVQGNEYKTCYSLCKKFFKLASVGIRAVKSHMECEKASSSEIQITAWYVAVLFTPTSLFSEHSSIIHARDGRNNHSNRSPNNIWLCSYTESGGGVVTVDCNKAPRYSANVEKNHPKLPVLVWPPHHKATHHKHKQEHICFEV